MWRISQKGKLECSQLQSYLRCVVSKLNNENVQLQVEYRKKLATEIMRRETVEREHEQSLKKIGELKKEIRGLVHEESRLTGVVQKQSNQHC